jgi:dihydrofolate reductase
MNITAIAAVDENLLMGGPEGIPWTLPRDSRHLREFTGGHFFLLGRRTYEEMIGWFTDQKPLVMTTREDYQPPVGQVVRSVPEAAQVARAAGEDNLVVGGGARIFEAAMPHLTQMSLTRVHSGFEGDVHFPQWDAAAWQRISSRFYPPDEEHEFPMTFETWVRTPAHG